MKRNGKWKESKYQSGNSAEIGQEKEQGISASASAGKRTSGAGFDTAAAGQKFGAATGTAAAREDACGTTVSADANTAAGRAQSGQHQSRHESGNEL